MAIPIAIIVAVLGFVAVFPRLRQEGRPWRPSFVTRKAASILDFRLRDRHPRRSPPFSAVLEEASGSTLFPRDFPELEV